jgi:hypothetical protein
MSDEGPLNPADRELEAALGALHLSPTPIDRDQLMFEAGRRSVPPQQRPIAWQALSGALAAALLLSLTLHRPSPLDVERIAYVPSATSSAPVQPQAPTQTDEFAPRTTLIYAAPAPTASSYLTLRQRVLTDDNFNVTTPNSDHSKRPTPSNAVIDSPTDAGFFGRISTPNRESL